MSELSKTALYVLGIWALLALVVLMTDGLLHLYGALVTVF